MGGFDMSENSAFSKDEFLYPRSRYYGNFTPTNLVLNANLQEFSSQIAILCALETGGKLSGDEAYKQIKRKFKQLKQSRKSLKAGNQPPGSE
jgi:hypothetical protein